MIYRVLIFSCLSLGLLACQKPGNNPQVAATVRNEEIDGSRSYGGADSGGSQSLQGRPLESFSVDIRNEAAFDLVAVVLNKLIEVHPRFASELIHIARERRWYIIPADLSRIPRERLGVTFETDQLARHSRREIWINETMFRGMTSDSDRALLLLHELVMGVFFMKFQDGLDHCYAQIALHSVRPQFQEEYTKMRKDCARRYSFPGESLTDISLSAEENMNIREMVGMLWSQYSILTYEELHAWIKSRHFRDY